MLANYSLHGTHENLCKGVNSRLDEIQAAVIDVNLTNLDADNARRREITSYYCENIKNPLITLPKEHDAIGHVFVVR